MLLLKGLENVTRTKGLAKILYTAFQKHISELCRPTTPTASNGTYVVFGTTPIHSAAHHVFFSTGLSFLSSCWPLVTTQKRFLSSSAPGSGRDGEAGPPSAKVKFIPFSVSQEKALDYFNAYHFGALISRKSADFNTIQQVYVPTWVTSAAVQVVVKSADIGTNYLTRRYNPRTRREETAYETSWQTVFLTMSWRSFHEATEPDMQVAASEQIPRTRMRPLRPGDRVKAARSLDAGMLLDEEGRRRQLLPFSLKPEVGRAIVMSGVEAREREEAERLIRQAFNCDQVRLINMDVRPVDVVTSPVYVPLFIFSTQHLGKPLQTLVTGTEPAAASGTRIYDEKIVAAVTLKITAIFVAASVFAPGGPPFMHNWSVAGLLLLLGLPPLLTGAVARYLPLLMEQKDAAQQVVGDAWHGRRNAEAHWDAEWVRPYSTQHEYERRQRTDAGAQEEARNDYWEHAQWQEWEQQARDWRWQQQRTRQGRRQGQQQQQQQQQEGWPGARRAAPGQDHLGYYHTLGLQPGADEQAIQSAFRNLAKEHHPDRVSGTSAKADATKRFQRITEAYNVLRDPAKRQQYDQGITPR